MSTFRLTIVLGNAAMQTPADIAGALREVADRIGDGHDPAVPTGTPGIIRDLNGAVVGAWEVDA